MRHEPSRLAGEPARRVPSRLVAETRRASSPAKRKPRRICFVSGTRAEFGLMRSVLHAITAAPSLRLQIVLTGMHLDRSRGRSIDAIRREGWKVDRVVPWKAGKHSPIDTAQATGRAIAAMASAYAELKPDVVLVVGDRVEAFAAAAAAHIAGIVVAHVHGGDRALGLVDDSLRHAITKLSHLHFPATRQSARRIKRLGEDPRRIVRTGAPGLDGMLAAAAQPAEVVAAFPMLRPREFALLALHPATTDPKTERKSARTILAAARKTWRQVVVIYPNNDPGSAGIAAEWDARYGRDVGVIFCRDLPRAMFLGLLRDAAALIGNSSAGIIEAASVGTPVLDIGPRQTGRERSGNVRHVEMNAAKIAIAVERISRARRWRCGNVYIAGGAGRRIAAALAGADLEGLRRKLIAY
ncbi:MAG TPA: UDP-N-acetylglucosamine 2-epimerase [Tepidisphaeraceae bacterium]|jgi:UDP-hydrolysing UDP-N-acetyl-D-glucosamine 2-epimerase|nr:UDP-N-acetylglucosamine 2-epimerase [Tepidisphaeraceae bacterium]